MRRNFAAIAALLVATGIPDALAQSNPLQPASPNPYAYNPSNYDPGNGRYREPGGDTIGSIALSGVARDTQGRTIHGLPRGGITYEVVPDPLFFGDPVQIERCRNRYPGYDPRTNAFLGGDGNYYYCRLAGIRAF